jgi:signal transduction histidine kinase
MAQIADKSISETSIGCQEYVRMTEKPIVNRLFAVPKELLRGDSVFAFLIFVVVAVFLANTGASVWQNIVFQRDLKEEASVQNVRAVGSMLAKTTEALLVANEISTLRRAIAEAGLEHHLKSCQIVLPDGGIIAAADPHRITVVELPKSWARHNAEYTETLDGDSVMFSFPLDVLGRGSASLEIVAKIRDHLGAGLEPPTAQMAIACLALAAMLLVHRHTRFRLKAIGAIHEVLLAVRGDEADISTLEVDPQLGQEAVAWNTLLGKKQGLQVRAAIEQVKESIQQTADVNVELVAACDALPGGLVLVDEHMRVNYANGAAAVLLQTSRSELVNRNVSEFITDERVIEAVHGAADGPTYKRTIVEVGRDGSTASGVLRFIVRPLRREDVGLAMVIIEDVTQQRVAEAARNNFLTKAAHELRTPLTNVQLYVENALESLEHDLDATAKSLNVINNESKRLARIVSDLLSVSEVETGSLKLTRDDVRLDELLQQLRADYEPQANEKQIALRFNLPPKLPVLQADRDKICLALHNLLGNALKYTPQNGQVTVSATLQEGQINIEFTDTGIGIGPEDIDRVFDRFYRARDKRVVDVTGSGLGLTIAREVIRLHGGDISVESELDKGSTFTLTLPITEEATLNEHPDTTTGSSNCG